MQYKEEALQYLDEKIAFAINHTERESNIHFNSEELLKSGVIGSIRDKYGIITVVDQSRALLYLVDSFGYGEATAKARINRLRLAKDILVNLEEVEDQEYRLSIPSQFEIMGMINDEYRLLSFLQNNHVTMDILDIGYRSLSHYSLEYILSAKKIVSVNFEPFFGSYGWTMDFLTRVGSSIFKIVAEKTPEKLQIMRNKLIKCGLLGPGESGYAFLVQFSVLFGVCILSKPYWTEDTIVMKGLLSEKIIDELDAAFFKLMRSSTVTQIPIVKKNTRLC